MNQFIRYSLDNPEKGKAKIIRNETSITFKYPCQNQTDCSPYKITLRPGKFQFEVWGAKGGSFSTIHGGRGGYSSGALNIYTKTQMFIYLGGSHDFEPTNIIQIGSYNGGGNGSNNHTHTYKAFGCAGGGSTDIRLKRNNLNTRLIVAGGGGGCGNQTENTAGYGGGLNGGNGTVDPINTKNYQCLIQGGTQTSGGLTRKFEAYGTIMTNASLGNGCSIIWTDGTGWPSGGGGGGGCGCVYGGGGAGGSGFVFSEKYAKQKSELSDIYKLKDPILENGNTKYGNYGSGMCRITLISKYTDPFPIIFKTKVKQCLKSLICVFIFSNKSE